MNLKCLNGPKFKSGLPKVTIRLNESLNRSLRDDLKKIGYASINEPSGNCCKGHVLGGQNGGSIRVNTIFAVKIIDLQQGEAFENFNAECEVLRNIRHRNLVKVITSCSSIDKRRVEFKALVMEVMSSGNLEKWLYPEDTDSGLTSTLIQRLNIAIDVASA